VQNIFVEVSGNPGSGKSAVLQIIEAALKAEGVTVSWPVQEHPRRTTFEQERAVTSIIKAGTEVVLVENFKFIQSGE